jgi:hypothetical protein
VALNITNVSYVVTLHQGFSYCRDILVGKLEEFKVASTNESMKKMLNFSQRKLDKMKSFLSDFLQQHFCLRGEVS